jgi:hypothetical protein
VTINVLVPRRIALADGRLLFSAVSYVGDRLILVGCHYFDRPIAYERLQYRLRPATAKISDLRHYVRVDYEPCIVISANVSADTAAVEFYYEGQSWTISLDREDPRPCDRSLMTLFKDDYRLLPEFIRYYSNLGVERFYLYYNGPLKSVDWEFLRNSEKVRGADILLIEWDIAYWWKLSAPVGMPFYDEPGRQHHAQTMAMNHHLHSVRGHSAYTLFVDLDEYVFTPKDVLDRCCKTNPAFVIMQSWWASLPKPVTYEMFSIVEDQELLVAESGEGRWRVKSLVNTADVDLMGIHIPHVYSRTDHLIIDGFFHFPRFVENDRAHEIDKRLIPWIKSEFIRQRFDDKNRNPAIYI